MLRTNLGSIDPENMDATARFVVGTFLKNNPLPQLEKSRQYSITLFSEKEKSDVVYEFTFNNHFIRRQRKDGKQGERYECITRDIGKGNNGTVYLSVGTLRLNDSLAAFKSKLRAVKEFKSDREAALEFEFSDIVPHLHAKPIAHAKSIVKPFSNIESSYMVENYMPGEDLYKIINHEKRSQLSFTTDQRIEISINILLAVQQQAHNLGLIHRDIKPENIMLDCRNNEVKLVDYRYSKKISGAHSQPDPAGTLITIPPEQFADYPLELQIYTPKSDSYATGKTLAEFWRAKPEVNSVKARTRSELIMTFFTYSQKDTQYKYHKFLAGDLSDEHSQLVKNMLEQLTRTKPEDRWTLDQAIVCLQQIQQERMANKANNNLCAGKP